SSECPSRHSLDLLSSATCGRNRYTIELWRRNSDRSRQCHPNDIRSTRVEMLSLAMCRISGPILRCKLTMVNVFSGCLTASIDIEKFLERYAKTLCQLEQV